jgi:hypothetical protein
VWRTVVLLSVPALVALFVLDLSNDSFSAWWMGHPVVTAVLLGVLAGVIAGFIVDKRARTRARVRWGFLRERAVLALCDAATAAYLEFDTADTERIGGVGLHPRSRVYIDAANEAAGDFAIKLAEWRGPLMETDDNDFLRRCEAYARSLSRAALFMESDRRGHDVSSSLALSPQIISDHEAYFVNLREQLTTAEFTRTEANVRHMARKRPSLKQRLELWMAERYMANVAKRAHRMSNESTVRDGEPPNSERVS